jgi:hypothetical protein
MKETEEAQSFIKFILIVHNTIANIIEIQTTTKGMQILYRSNST